MNNFIGMSLKRFFCVKTNQNLVESILKLPAISSFGPGEIHEFLKSTPELQSYPSELWQKSYENLVNEGFTATKFLNIINLNPKLLYRDPVKLHQQIDQWRSFQFGEKITIELLETHPHLLEVKNFTDVTKNLDFLKSFVKTFKNVARVLQNNPDLVFDKLDTLEEKIKYFQNVMKVDHTEVIKSSAFASNLEKIKTRHVFLERLGLYETKTKKTADLEPSLNPKLYQILDTSDKRFATKVCFVTLEEYETFVELYKKELARDSEESDDDV